MRWIEPTSIHPCAALTDLPPLVAQTLTRRGISTRAAARAFLDPAAYAPAPASDLPGLAAAADRLEAAIRSHETVCVWGDFDVDGQTSTTILYSTLLALGADVIYHIPVRARESHGVNLPLLTEIIDRGAQLILTCDTGITATEAADYARARRVDLVITDHHDLPDRLPQAAAIVNPKLLPAGHPLAGLSGSGVAYKLAEELLRRSPCASISPADLVDLAALGLVADLALLTGDARYLVQRGLEALRKTSRLGLRLMLEMAELNPACLTEEHIGFVLGPRLNALGRLGDANPVVEFFTTSDAGRARLIATQLEGLNVQRQLLTTQVAQAAEAQLRADPSLLDQPVLVLAHPVWPGGVIGIAASRLVERYHRPVILFSAPPDGLARGSARSIEGLNITSAIAAQKDLLLGFGGHPMAAGLSLEPEKLPEFRRRLARTVGKMMAAAEIEPSLQIDAWLDLPEADLELAAVMEQLAPFGPGNEKLVLASRNLSLQSAATIGRNREHVKLTLADENGRTQTVLWWNGAASPLPEGRFDLAYTIRASDWRGTPQVQLEFVDFRVVEEKPVEIKKPRLEVIDYRAVKRPQALVKSLPEGTLLWTEAQDKKTLGGLDRIGLTRCESLAIWTTPASPEILHSALEVTRPQKVFLFAVHPSAEEPRAFLERLMGLVKFAINRRAGRAALSELAAATAQREAAIQLGLQWLVDRGDLILAAEGDQLSLSAGNQPPNPYAQMELLAGIKMLLDETRAYRAHFASADKESLIFSPKNE